MPTPSLAEIVLRNTTVLLELLPALSVATGKDAADLLSACCMSLHEMEAFAQRRMMASDQEATRRAGRELVKDIQAFIPSARA